MSSLASSVWDPQDAIEWWPPTPSPSVTPTPMDDPEPTSKRGRYYLDRDERDELYRDRLLAEGHVIHLERGGDWSVVMGHEVQAL